MKRLTRGFTLIELLVVLSIVALLLTIAVPRYFNALDKSREAVLRDNLRVLRQCIERYQADTGHYPETLQTLVEAKYLKAVPVDPITESDHSWRLTQGDQPGEEGVIDVHSGAEGKAHDGLPYVDL